MLNDVTIRTLARLSGGEDWRLSLAHDRPHHLLIWVTRGQGRLLLDGQRRGVGAHNAVFVPAGSLFALELGRQALGLAVMIPPGIALRLPELPRHLRIRDVHMQTELSGLIETAQREQDGTRPLKQDALEGYAALISVWLRRTIALDEHVPEPRDAAARLSARFCRMVTRRYASGVAMAQYAAALGITPTHLTRSVRKATGRSAADIITERVLYEARDLLGTTPHSAKDIARHLGFGSAAYFSRFILTHCGKPPGQMRGRA